jgi:Carboxypeptidase C (cathepsin A)
MPPEVVAAYVDVSAETKYSLGLRRTRPDEGRSADCIRLYSVRDMSDDEPTQTKPDHEPPRGAACTQTWNEIEYTATAKWLVLRKKEKPSAEIFSVSYVRRHRRPRPSGDVRLQRRSRRLVAYLHVGAVGPQRVDFPADGTLPPMPPRLVQNDESWLAFTDLVFVDPVGTGFSRIIEKDEKKGRRQEEGDDDKKGDEPDPKEYFGYKRDLESLSEFIGRWLSSHGAGDRLSSSQARATAGIASAASSASSKRPPGSG